MVTIQKHYFTATFKGGNALKNWLVLLFFTLGSIGILRHEMWRDELQAWLIAKDSSSLIDLFNNLRYEGHPALWHSCLYLITRITHNPLAMQIFHLLLATSVIYIFIEFSPFSRLQKILFTFGYFPFYEYSIISRSYSLGILLIFIFCVLYPTRHQGYFRLSIILALLANTHAYGLMNAIVFAITLVLDLFLKRDVKILLNAHKWNRFISLFIFLLAALMAIFQMLVPNNADFEGDVINIEERAKLSFLNHRLLATIVTIWRSYIPIPNFYEGKFWNTNVLINSDSFVRICAILFSIILILYSTAIFIRKPMVLFLYLSGNLEFLVFIHTKFSGALRHQGHLFFLFLACVWISSYYINSNVLVDKLKNVSESRKSLIKKLNNNINLVDKSKNIYISGILFTHLVAGLFAFSMDLNYTFSGSKEVANYITQQGLQNYLLIGSRDYAASPVAAFLDSKIYYIESNKLGSFIVWKNRELLKQREVIDRVERLIQQNKKALLILNYKLKDKRPDMNISLMLKSSLSIVPEETYYLYLIQKKLVKN